MGAFCVRRSLQHRYVNLHATRSETGTVAKTNARKVIVLRHACGSRIGIPSGKYWVGFAATPLLDGEYRSFCKACLSGLWFSMSPRSTPRECMTLFSVYSSKRWRKCGSVISVSSAACSNNALPRFLRDVPFSYIHISSGLCKTPQSRLFIADIIDCGKGPVSPIRSIYFDLTAVTRT